MYRILIVDDEGILMTSRAVRSRATLDKIVGLIEKAMRR